MIVVLAWLATAALEDYAVKAAMVRLLASRVAVLAVDAAYEDVVVAEGVQDLAVAAVAVAAPVVIAVPAE